MQKEFIRCKICLCVIDRNITVKKVNKNRYEIVRLEQNYNLHTIMKYISWKAIYWSLKPGSKSLSESEQDPAYSLSLKVPSVPHGLPQSFFKT